MLHCLRRTSRWRPMQWSCLMRKGALGEGSAAAARSDAFLPRGATPPNGNRIRCPPKNPRQRLGLLKQCRISLRKNNRKFSVVRTLHGPAVTGTRCDREHLDRRDGKGAGSDFERGCQCTGPRSAQRRLDWLVVGDQACRAEVTDRRTSKQGLFVQRCIRTPDRLR